MGILLFHVERGYNVTYTQLDYYTKEHDKKVNQIWKDLQYKLYRKYLAQGYNQWFAEVKAEKEALELMSKSQNPHSMPPKGEFHFLEGESLD